MKDIHGIEPRCRVSGVAEVYPVALSLWNECVERG